MASEEDNFDIDIYGDGGEDYGQDDAQDEIKAEDISDQPTQLMEVGPDTSTDPVVDSHPDDSRLKQEGGHSESDPAQKIASTDESAPDPLHLPKQAPQTQGLKRKDGVDDRPVDPGATSALFISELNWWINDDDLRGWANQSQCEDELEEITFSEHKVNGKSKGQAYVLFKSPQAATATKRKAESFSEGQYSMKKFTINYTNPYANPFKTLPKDGPMRNTPGNSNRSSSGAHGGSGSSQGTGYNNYRGNRGGGYNRGGGMNNMSGFNRGGFQQSMATGFQGSNMGGFQGSPMSGVQSYGGFQGRGGMAGGMRGGTMGIRGGRGGMTPNPMMGMSMGGMGMGGMGAMGMSMPQMAGGMGMQGMAGSFSSTPVYQSPYHGPSAISAGHNGFPTAQPPHIPPSGSGRISPPAIQVGKGPPASSNPSSAWASYTQYSSPPSTRSPSQAPSDSPSQIVDFPHSSTRLNAELVTAGTQAHFNPAFFPQGQQNGGSGEANWNPHGAKRTRQE